jgi:hypothetical protein
MPDANKMLPSLLIENGLRWALRAHRSPSEVARRPVSREDSGADDLLSAKSAVLQGIRRAVAQNDLVRGIPI